MAVSIAGRARRSGALALDDLLLREPTSLQDAPSYPRILIGRLPLHLDLFRGADHLWYTLAIMKSLKCDLCEVTAQGETFEAWMQALYTHYQAAHAEVMSDPSKTAKDGEKWMAENKARFEAA